MSDVHETAPKGHGIDPSTALQRLIDAASVLEQLPEPSLEPGRPRYLPPLTDLVRDLEDWREAVMAAAPAQPQEVPALDLADLEQVGVWVQHLREQIDDAIGAGEDATRREEDRDLGRRMARKILLDARGAIGSLLRAAERALPAEAHTAQPAT